MTFDDMLKILEQSSTEESPLRVDPNQFTARLAEHRASEHCSVRGGQFYNSYWENGNIEPANTYQTIKILTPAKRALVKFSNAKGEIIGEIIYENNIFSFTGNVEESMQNLIKFLNENYKSIEFIKKDNTEKIIDSDRNIDLE
jgi:hypothetical protein